ncbi:hypothetical protein [Proteus sp. FME41]|uniref:hypothetical protein n=1 Tax=Proteus sp. FME41 TaxID=2742608 RepID=UPI0018681BF5|nr:hypothetical protein [Proteus sp. FME41]
MKKIGSTYLYPSLLYEIRECHLGRCNNRNIKKGILPMHCPPKVVSSFNEENSLPDGLNKSILG